MGFLAGKRLLITGVLNNRSIAYGIARACHREGAELAFSYQGERFKDRIREIAALLSTGAPDPQRIKEIMLRHGLVPVPASRLLKKSMAEGFQT